MRPPPLLEQVRNPILLPVPVTIATLPSNDVVMGLSPPLAYHRPCLAASLAMRTLLSRWFRAGAENAQVYRTRSGSVFLPKDADWISATEDLRTAFVKHPELNPDPRVVVSGGHNTWTIWPYKLASGFARSSRFVR